MNDENATEPLNDRVERLKRISYGVVELIADEYEDPMQIIKDIGPMTLGIVTMVWTTLMHFTTDAEFAGKPDHERLQAMTLRSLKSALEVAEKTDAFQALMPIMQSIRNPESMN